MSDWPAQVEKWGLEQGFISIGSPLALGAAAYRIGAAVSPASVAWPAINRVLLWPFRLPRQVTVYQVTVGCGATAGGDFDAGIYDEAGNRLMNTSSTARVASSEVHVNTADLIIGPGVYWAALQASGTDNYIGQNAANAGLVKATGIRQASPGSFGLPATVTFETAAGVMVPLGVGFHLRSF